jgi:hypothetical protein
VLSSDGLSSAAYGTEEILYALIPFFGLAAFTLVLPMTLLVLFGVVLVVMSYREVVSVYTRAGGSYVVARENFGPRAAQVAAVALMIDYVVTVAVQTAAGSAAIVSAFPALSRLPVIGPKILLVISALAICAMCAGNLRGIREAGRTFAVPTYLFAGSVIVMIVTGVVRELTGDLPTATRAHGMISAGSHSGLIAFAAIYIMARAFANGGSSLTGIEAVSNAVSALRPPEGRNARQLLAIQGSLVAFLIAGISWLAHATHATRYAAGFLTVIVQEASLVFGGSAAGHLAFFILQAGTAAILFTGGNTSFTGFPYLASFVAEDSYLPRWLTRRGQRLARHLRDRGPAPARLPAAGRACAARPHRRQDRSPGQPRSRRGGHHHSVRRHEPQRGRTGQQGSRVARSGARNRPDRLAAARPGHRAGPAADRAATASTAEQHTRLPDHGLDRRPHRPVLRPHPHPGAGARRTDPAARDGRRRRGRSADDDQPELRAHPVAGILVLEAVARTALPWSAPRHLAS